MGYTTEFKGSFKFSKKLTTEQKKYLELLANTRRMKRSESLCENYYDPFREAVNLPIGIEGEYTVFSNGFKGQTRDLSVLDYNTPPKTQLSLWLQWTPSEDGTRLEWDGGEKFYCYFEWLEYISINIFKKWDNLYLTGTVYYSGERRDDKGKIKAYEDRIEFYKGKVLEKTINF